MSIIIDRRQNAGKKSTINRQRFLRRYKSIIKKAVEDSVHRRSITDVQRGDDIHIPRKDLSEPVFHSGRGGRNKRIHPGNKAFHKGDRFTRPRMGSGQGSGDGSASDSGEGVDDFVFQINRDEFLEYIFEDLELPNMVRKELRDTTEFSLRRGGFTSVGSPDRLNVIRSLRAAHARRIALSGKERKEIRALKRELREMEVSPEETDEERAEEIRGKIIELNKKLKRLPFIDEFDLKFNNLIKVPLPTSKAVMFCIMDISGSMTETIKDIAKRFFLLLYLFLQRNYESVDVVFIRHHTEAKECDEIEFFYARETGGTLVSKALQLTHEIIEARYPADQWNLYIAQASDGDNWESDSVICREVISEKLLPKVQYFAYVEVADRPQNLWYTYKQIEQEFADHFALQRIHSRADIYPVFRRLFEKRDT